MSKRAAFAALALLAMASVACSAQMADTGEATGVSEGELGFVPIIPLPGLPPMMLLMCSAGTTLDCIAPVGSPGGTMDGYVVELARGAVESCPNRYTKGGVFVGRTGARLRSDLRASYERHARRDVTPGARYFTWEEFFRARVPTATADMSTPNSRPFCAYDYIPRDRALDNARDVGAYVVAHAQELCIGGRPLRTTCGYAADDDIVRSRVCGGC